tara:strand:- start:1075 stop:1914 length:840 start_codon:yes stop_codon:yes gene_type:complete
MKPMLCHSIKEEDIGSWFGKENYQANIKYDGERIMAVVEDGKVTLVNRKGNIKTDFYPEVAQSLEGSIDCVLDGEVISLGDDFHRLLKRAKTQDKNKRLALQKEIPVKFMVFDVIQWKPLGSLVDYTLKERVQTLDIIERSLPDVLIDMHRAIEFVKYGDIQETYRQAMKEDREGIIVKDMESKYDVSNPTNSVRSHSWLKCKFFKKTTLTLKKYERNNAGIRCEDNDGNVVQVSGLQHQKVRDQIDNEGECKVEVQYLEMTQKGRLRNPSYVGLQNEI